MGCFEKNNNLWFSEHLYLWIFFLCFPVLEFCWETSLILNKICILHQISLWTNFVSFFFVSFDFFFQTETAEREKITQRTKKCGLFPALSLALPPLTIARAGTKGDGGGWGRTPPSVKEGWGVGGHLHKSYDTLSTFSSGQIIF